MTLTPGTRLGPYEVSGPLGVGGMGEVYRARDSRLSREVAIKVLPADLAADAGRLKRFEKEARSASALNHPNIVTIYEFGTSNSLSYIAMELVEGKTLRELLVTGPLPVKRVLSIAAQVAEGLARAHETGIVHRDLKPENLMVTKDGRVKILDFGLAKLTQIETDGAETTQLPTQTGTGAGTILGTVGYMSPEQASGQPVDFRSDQFSFGSILYEVLTGERAFQRKSAVQTLAAIIQEEPEPISALNSQTPGPLQWIVDRCLSKDPEERYGTTRDLARELATIRDHLSEAGLSPGVPASPTVRAQAPFRLLALLLPLAILGLWFWTDRGTRKAAASVPTFRQLTYRRVNVWTARFAPDGQTIVYSVFTRGRPELFSTRVGSRESRSLGVSPAKILAISTSGVMAMTLGTGYLRGTLAQASLAGGEPREILENVASADWSPDGKALAVVHVVDGKHRLEYPVGKVLYQSPFRFGARLSPKGDRFAMSESGSLSLMDLSGNKKELAKDAMHFDWSPADEIWFNRIAEGGTRILAVKPSGSERPIVSLPGEFNLLDVSRDGRILVERGMYRSEVLGRFPGDDRERSLTWLDTTIPCDLSPDGTMLLFSENEPGWKNAEVYLRKTDASDPVRLGEGFCRALSPDKKWAISLPSNPATRLVLLPTGAGQAVYLPNDGLEPFEMPDSSWANWLPDGKGIVFAGRAVGQRPRLFAQEVPNGKPRPISPEGVQLSQSTSVSPDGASVFGVSDEGWFFYPVEGGEPRPIPGLSEGDQPIGWDDRGGIYIIHEGEVPIRIWSLDAVTGKRKLSKEIRLPDAEAVQYLDRIMVTPDGRFYVHSYSRWLADLWLVEGVK